MTAVKLSICIPTYNRAPYLRSALARFEGYAFSFPYEIVISDNASTDDTRQVVDEFIAKGLPIQYHRRAVNGGGTPNMLNAYNHAVGQYVTYHADDDFLFAEGVEEAVAYLDAHDDVISCQAPWYLYNEVADIDTGQFYHVPETVKFSRHSFVELFQFIYDRHVFPEIGIHRASAVRSAMIPYQTLFWAFSSLAHFLDQGAVAFLSKPFYRSVTLSKIASSRQQMGNDDVMTSWDSYRGGLEYYLHIAAKRGMLNMSDEARAIYDQMCKIFTMIRMTVAVRFWVAAHGYIKAYEIYARLALGGFGEHPEVLELRKLFPAMVTLELLAYHLNATTGITHLVLSDVDDPAYITGLLREVGLEDRIAILSDPASQDPALVGQSAIFSTDSGQRDALIAAGYAPNFLFFESDFSTYVLL